MTNENLLPFDPNKVPDLIGQRTITTPTLSIEERLVGETRTHERAKQLFGEDFLGEDAIHVMEQKFQTAGIDVRFEIPQIIDTFNSYGMRVGLTDQILEIAKKDETTGRSRMVVLRPEFMDVSGVRKEVTLSNLRKLFIKESQDSNGNSKIEYINPFGDGDVFWRGFHELTDDHLIAGFGLPTKEVIDDSLNKDWDVQQKLLLPGERRRLPVETGWDVILYYAKTRKKLLENTSDWTGYMSDGHFVYVGPFFSDGLYMNRVRPLFGNSRINLGVCPSR